MSDSSHAAERIRGFLSLPWPVSADERDQWRVSNARAGEALDALLVALRQAEADRDDRAKRAYEKGVAYGEAERVRLETALREALDCKGPYSGTVSESGGRPALCFRCEERAREALSAGEVPGSTGGEDE